MTKRNFSHGSFVFCALTQICSTFFSATLSQVPPVLESWNAEAEEVGDILWVLRIMLCHVTEDFRHDTSLQYFKGHAGPKEVNGKFLLDSNTAKKQLNKFFCQVGVFQP